MWKTGHSHLKRKMREDGILLGGEVSGHMFFAEGYYGVDDGILASAKIVEIAARTAQPISTLFDSVPHRCATPGAGRRPCPDAEKFRVIDELVGELRRRYETIDIDGARVLFPGGGWGLVPRLEHQPLSHPALEAHTEGEIADMKRVIYGALRRYPSVTLLNDMSGRGRRRGQAGRGSQQPATASRTAASGPGTRGQSRRPQWPPGSRRMAVSPAARAPARPPSRDPRRRPPPPGATLACARARAKMRASGFSTRPRTSR